MPTAAAAGAVLCLVLAALLMLPGQVEIQGPAAAPLPADHELFMFGPAEVRGASVVAGSPLSLAFVNKKPVVEGHLLVVPRRAVDRLELLEEREVTDLFLMVQKVDKFLQRLYKVSSTTISIQSRSLLH